MADHTERDIIINADAADILAVIADFANYPEWVSAAREVEVLSTDASGRAQQVTIRP